MKFLQFIIKSVFLGIPVGVTLVDTVGYIARVDGISMQPALNPDKTKTDYVFLNRWAVKSYEIHRGDIISLTSPRDPSLKIIKRVVGIEGDIILTLGYKTEVVKVPEGCCWIEGDHTGHSMDSNNFGPVSVGLVTAKASCIVWPPSRWQIIESFLPKSRIPLNLEPNRLEFQFTGNVVRNALTLGDVDNDGLNELIIGNANGDVAIFKGNENVHTISKLNFVSCVAVADILNQGRNCLIIITADGWCYVYEVPSKECELEERVEEVDGQCQSSSNANSSENAPRKKKIEILSGFEINRIHLQRIPANAKNIVVGDVDGDGQLEMVLGLTDRVVRSYRWVPNSITKSTSGEFNLTESGENLSGKFVALNKWECANQIGSITLHHTANNKPSLLIAQPGGTFMRIQCQSFDSSQETECSSHSSNSQGEKIPGSVDYQTLGLSRMRNQNISTEILGDLKCKLLDSDSTGKDRSCPYAVVTLDGTILLVEDELILWAMAVNHQVFALTKLDVTGDGYDEIVVCSWDGQTYILDQQKNSVRFHLEEPVQAFHSGYYSLGPNEPSVTCLVYVTFKNTVVLYYDLPLKNLVCKQFEPDLTEGKDFLQNKGINCDNIGKMDKKKLVQCLLYNVKH